MAKHRTRTLETKQEIKDAALRLFAARGWEGTTLDAISDELGYTKQALYYYFPSKEDLVCELIEDSLDRALLRMDHIKVMQTSCEDRLGALIRLHFEEYLDGRGFFNIYHQMESFMDHILVAERGQALRSKMDSMTSFIMDLVQSGISTGEFVPLDHKVLGGLILSMITGVLYHLNHPSLINTPKEELRELMTEFVLKGIRHAKTA